MSYIARTIIGAWCALFWISPSQAQDTIAPLVVDADGKPLCGEWPETLLQTGEQVKDTLYDRYGQKLKVVVNGDSWRLILMAGAEDSRFGCEIMAGEGFSSR